MDSQHIRARILKVLSGVKRPVAESLIINRLRGIPEGMVSHELNQMCIKGLVVGIMPYRQSCGGVYRQRVNRVWVYALPPKDGGA